MSHVETQSNLLDGFRRMVNRMRLNAGARMEPSSLAHVYEGYDQFEQFREPIENSDLIWVRNSLDLEKLRGKSKYLVVMMSTTAGGQTSVARGLQEMWPDEYNIVTTTTTRPPNTSRPDETNPVDIQVVPGLEAHGEKTNFYIHISPDTLQILDKADQIIERKTSLWGPTYASLIYYLEASLSLKDPYSFCVVDYSGLDAISAWMKINHPDIPVLPIFVMSEISEQELRARIEAKRDPKEVDARIVDADDDIMQTGRRSPNPSGTYPAVETPIVLKNPSHPSGEPRAAIKAAHAFFQWLKTL